MVKHTQKIRRMLSTNCLSGGGHFGGWVLKGLSKIFHKHVSHNNTCSIVCPVFNFYIFLINLLAPFISFNHSLTSNMCCANYHPVASAYDRYFVRVSHILRLDKITGKWERSKIFATLTEATAQLMKTPH